MMNLFLKSWGMRYLTGTIPNAGALTSKIMSWFAYFWDVTYDVCTRYAGSQSCSHMHACLCLCIHLYMRRWFCCEDLCRLCVCAEYDLLNAVHVQRACEGIGPCLMDGMTRVDDWGVVFIGGFHYLRCNDWGMMFLGGRHVATFEVRSISGELYGSVWHQIMIFSWYRCRKLAWKQILVRWVGWHTALVARGVRHTTGMWLKSTTLFLCRAFTSSLRWILYESCIGSWWGWALYELRFWLNR